jgi:hypothetical protein
LFSKALLWKDEVIGFSQTGEYYVELDSNKSF